MFTGIIQHLGRVVSIEPKGEGCRVVFEAGDIVSDLRRGDSISVDGVCSTALDITASTFCVDYLYETLQRTTIGTLSVGQTVNLELSATPTTRLGGHVVTGHVDTTGTVLAFEKREPWAEIKIGFPSQFAPLIVSKGSIGLHGISLTPVDVGDDYFTIHLIPETLSNTVLGQWSVGQAVNLEFDAMAKYVQKLVGQYLNKN